MSPTRLACEAHSQLRRLCHLAVLSARDPQGEAFTELEFSTPTVCWHLRSVRQFHEQRCGGYHLYVVQVQRPPVGQRGRREFDLLAEVNTERSPAVKRATKGVLVRARETTTRCGQTQLPK